jgi:hypothetical protein
MWFERAAAALVGVAMVGLVGFLLVRNQPVADARLFLALRVVLSLGAAILGATIPGFLSVGWHGNGLAVRAGGALALFVITWVYTPDLAAPEAASGPVTISAPGGVAAGRIEGGTFTVNPAPAK